MADIDPLWHTCANMSKEARHQTSPRMQHLLHLGGHQSLTRPPFASATDSWSVHGPGPAPPRELGCPAPCPLRRPFRPAGLDARPGGA
eukprot:12139022-Alexandrium_andersonii.AAC.1